MKVDRQLLDGSAKSNTALQLHVTAGLCGWTWVLWSSANLHGGHLPLSQLRIVNLDTVCSCLDTSQEVHVLPLTCRECSHHPFQDLYRG